MRRAWRFVVGLLVCLGGTVSTQPAAATGLFAVTSNTTATTMTATNPTITVNTASGTRVLICRTVTIPLGIDGAGSVQVAANASRFSTCTFSGVAITMTQPALWGGTFMSLRNAGAVPAITLDLTIPNNGIAISGAGCSFTLGGIPLGERRFLVQPAVGVLVNIPDITFPAVLDPAPLSLFVFGAAGTCGLLGIANGNSARLDGRFTFSPVVNAAG